jgi:site-specific DNA-adenine methylase
MWSYYGAKTNIVKFYPKPKHDKIIEPFAGSARYALQYFEKDVLLIDKYEVLINIWKWLQKCSVGDINNLPHIIKPGQSLEDFTFDCVEAKNLIGFLVGFGMERPRVTASVKRMNMRPNHVNYSLNRIARNLFKIKHWNIKQGCYSEIENQKATWFVDPPYQIGGHCYTHSNKNIDFNGLSEWCKSREGQVIVCESLQADWMDFKPLTTHKGVRGMQKEGIWCNEPTAYDNQQLKLIA